MMTKEQYCRYIIKQFADSEGKCTGRVTEDDIFKSSSLAVAMEYLGLLKTTLSKEYAYSRGGTVFLSVSDNKEIETLSVRELLSLLPETLE